MTDIYRRFNVETRSLVATERRYCGQVNDAGSTTLHFTYDPVDFLEHRGEGRPDLEYWVPYIMFSVADDYGNPCIYGPDPRTSTPTFDGYTFDIPWEVTNRVKSARLEYQLFFVKNTVKIDPFGADRCKLDRTVYLQSAIDGIAVKPSIGCKSRNPCHCPPMSPHTEPSVPGYINLWKDVGVVNPVTIRHNACMDRTTLYFPTYNGSNDTEIPLPFASLDSNGKIPARFLNIAEDWDGVTPGSIPMASMVERALEDKCDLTQSIPIWDSEKTYWAQSAVMYNGSLWISQNDANRDHVPGRDGWWAAPAVHSQGIPLWDSTMSYLKNATVLWDDAVYISLIDDNVNIPPSQLCGDVWKPICGCACASGKNTYTQELGDGYSTEFTVRHGFGTFNLMVTVRESDAPWGYADAEFTLVNKDVLTVEFTTPPSSREYTVIISPVGSSAVETVLGDGEQTEFVFRHMMGTRDFFPVVRTAGTPSRIVSANITALDDYQIRVEFDEPPAADGIIVQLMPAEKTYVIGDGESSEWVVRHDLHSLDFFSAVRRMDDGGYVDAVVLAGGCGPDRTEDDIDEVSFGFTEPPEADSLRVMIWGGTETDSEFIHVSQVWGSPLASNVAPSETLVKPALDELADRIARLEQSAPETIFFREPRTQWVINHNRGRRVMVQIYANDTGMTIGHIVQDGNTVTISFDEPVSGYAVIAG